MPRGSARLSGVFDWLNPKSKKPGPSAPAPAGVPFDVDLYHFFGVDPGATSDEIRAAYRDLASKFHPDRNEGDPIAARRFQEIVNAYQILSDPAKRAAYDKTRGVSPGRSSTSLPIIAPEIPRREAPIARGGAVVPARPAGAPPKASSFWESMFSPAEPEASKEMFKGFEERRREPERPSAEAPWGWMAPFSEKRPVSGAVDIPTLEDLYLILREWPLEEIFDLVRQERRSPGYRGSVPVDVVAGQEGVVEWDLAELFGIPLRQADEFIRYRGSDAFLREVLYPVFEDLTRALDYLKPADIPGHFFLDWDPSGRMVELVYAEEAGRRGR